MGQRRAFLIGNQAFDPEVSGLQPLQGPHNDVGVLREVLGAKDRGDFAVETFLDATSGEILQALDAAAGEATRDDTLLIFYAGHGTISRSGVMCLATADTRRDRVQSTSVPSDSLISILNECPSTVVLLLDCCYAADVAKHLRGDPASMMAKFAEQATGAFVLASSSSHLPSQEVEEDGMMLGRFTAAIRRGLANGEAAFKGQDVVRFSALRAWVEQEMRGGQRPHYAVGSRAQGDPVIAQVPRRDDRRIALLGRWLEAGQINLDDHAVLSEALLGATDAKRLGLLRGMLDRPGAKAKTVVAWWHAAPGDGGDMPPTSPPDVDRTSRSGPGIAQGGDGARIPEKKDTDKRHEKPREPRAEFGWQLLPIALVAGTPAGLIMANTQIAYPGDAPVIVAICSSGVFVASVLAQLTVGWTFQQDAIRLGLLLTALFAASALAAQGGGPDFGAAFLPFGLIAGVVAWRLLARPIARGAERPLAGLLPGVIAAGVGTVAALTLASGLFASNLSRYSSRVPGALGTAALAAVGVVCALCLTAALRRSKSRPGAAGPMPDARN